MKICDSCYIAAQDEGISEESIDYILILAGADIADHICEELETGTGCACACH